MVGYCGDSRADAIHSYSQVGEARGRLKARSHLLQDLRFRGCRTANVRRRLPRGWAARAAWTSRRQSTMGACRPRDDMLSAWIAGCRKARTRGSLRFTHRQIDRLRTIRLCYVFRYRQPSWCVERQDLRGWTPAATTWPDPACARRRATKLTPKQELAMPTTITRRRQSQKSARRLDCSGMTESGAPLTYHAAPSRHQPSQWC